MFLLLTVVSGATCVLASPDAFLRRPRLCLELISEFRATCTPVPSFTLPLVLRRGDRPVQLGSLRNLILTNEPIYKACVDEFVLHAGSVRPRRELHVRVHGVAAEHQPARGRAPIAQGGPAVREARFRRDHRGERGARRAGGGRRTSRGEVWVSSHSNVSRRSAGRAGPGRRASCARATSTAA
jgi:hypothetical protein